MKKPEILVDEKIRSRMKAIAALRGVTLQNLTADALGDWLAKQPELASIQPKEYCLKNKAEPYFKDSSWAAKDTDEEGSALFLASAPKPN